MVKKKVCNKETLRFYNIEPQKVDFEATGINLLGEIINCTTGHRNQILFTDFEKLVNKYIDERIELKLKTL
jgi:hypothetical protein